MRFSNWRQATKVPQPLVLQKNGSARDGEMGPSINPEDMLGIFPARAARGFKAVGENGFDERRISPLDGRAKENPISRSELNLNGGRGGHGICTSHPTCLLFLKTYKSQISQRGISSR